jgi:L,D-peptidoglycan transpeptidase YkuD (ErfK/YbiS/YcfS/YnhG family)
MIAVCVLILLVIVAVGAAAANPYKPSEVDKEAFETRAASAPAAIVSKPTTQAAPAILAASLEPTRSPAPQSAPAPIPAPAPKPTTMPDEMARLKPPHEGAVEPEQIVIITGSRIGSNSGRLALYDKESGRWVKKMDVKAYFGKNGLVDGIKRQTGNLETPTGLWTIGEFLFGLHGKAPRGTQMPYRPIKEDSYWSSVRNSTYNSWVNGRVDGEHLIKADPQYEYAFNTGYNSLPNERVLGRGTAIFIHCSEPPGNSLGKYTHGCVAISPENMVKLFKRLDPAKNPACAIGTLQKGSSTSIWAY